MAGERILVVEDEEDILDLIRFKLEREGYVVRGCANGEDALRAASQDRPNLILLDLMLPGVDGLEVCRRLRSDPHTSRIPVVMLTAKSEEIDVVAGLEVGADDYIPKPFSPRILLARIRAVLRRHKPARAAASEEIIRTGSLTIDPDRHEVKAGTRVIELTATEFRLLQFMAGHPGRVYSRQQIVDGVKGEDYPVTDRSVDVQVVGLRRKLGDYSACIETVRGVGYRFREETPDSVEPSPARSRRSARRRS
ncbi:MAG: response regulator transcription factor [Kiritimatiellae bacterium]|nr:response regulator transcription factor [Kiritimatiellia bacterium]